MLGAAVNIESAWDVLTKVAPNATLTHESRDGDIVSSFFGLNDPTSFADGEDPTIKSNSHSELVGSEGGMLYLRRKYSDRYNTIQKKYSESNRYIKGKTYIRKDAKK